MRATSVGQAPLGTAGVEAHGPDSVYELAQNLTVAMHPVALLL